MINSYKVDKNHDLVAGLRLVWVQDKQANPGSVNALTGPITGAEGHGTLERVIASAGKSETQR